MAKNRFELNAGEVRAHAEMLAEAEREMRVRAAIHAEGERVVEDLLVAVRRREIDRHPIPSADLHAAHFAILGCRPREVADRAHPAEDLLHGVAEPIGLVLQLVPRNRMLAERQQRSADRVAGRLVSRLDDQLAVGHELLGRERHTADLGAQQLAHEVVAWVAPVIVDDPIEIGVQLPPCPFDRLARRLAGALVVGLFLVYNAMSVSVSERRHDIGILRSVGATRPQIRALFFGEAILMGAAGSALGVPLGLGLATASLGPMQQVLRDRIEDFEDHALSDNPEIEEFRPLLRSRLGLAEPGDPIKLLHHAISVLGADVIVRAHDGYPSEPFAGKFRGA